MNEYIPRWYNGGLIMIYSYQQVLFVNGGLYIASNWSTEWTDTDVKKFSVAYLLQPWQPAAPVPVGLSGLSNDQKLAMVWVVVSAVTAYTTADIDALIQGAGITQPVLIDALIQKQLSAGVNIDAMLQDSVSGIIGVDSLTSAVKSGLLAVDALIQTVLFQAPSLDAMAVERILVDSGIDALILAYFDQQTGFDAIIQVANYIMPYRDEMRSPGRVRKINAAERLRTVSSPGRV